MSIDDSTDATGSITPKVAPKRRGGKRLDGEGSFRLRADGSWECRITLANGQRKSFYGATLAEVKAKHKQGARDLDNGLDLTAPATTVDVFLRDWLDGVARPTIRPKTYESYAMIIRLRINPAIGKVKLARLTPQQVQRMINDLTAQGLSPRSVQYARAVLRRALNHALKWGLVTKNVATLVTPPRSNKKLIHPLDADEVSRFLDLAREREPRLWPLFMTAVYTGLRQGELLGLRWADVDLERRILRVTATLQRIDKEWTFVEPKTKRSARTLTLPIAAVDALREQRDRQTFERRAALNMWNDRDLVFTSPVGTPIDPSNLSKRLHSVLDAAGLPKQGMHALRHCCASLLLSQGVAARVVMDQLGHSQISLTMDTYSHVMPAMLREAANALDAALDRSKTG